eukprot:233460-Chlamydomonas_euryale.AAC.1
MAHGLRRMAHGAWRAAHGVRRMAHGAWRAAHCAWRAAHGVRRMATHGAWRATRGTPACGVCVCAELCGCMNMQCPGASCA